MYKFELIAYNGQLIVLPPAFLTWPLQYAIGFQNDRASLARLISGFISLFYVKIQR